MRRGLWMLILLAASPAWATFSLVQSVASAACGGTSATCAVTVASTGSGNVILVWLAGSADPALSVISSVSGGGTYSVPAGCAITDAGNNFSASCAYTLSSTSGTTSITVTRNNSTTEVWRVYVEEYSFTGSGVALDPGGSGGVGTVDQTSTCSTCTGVPLSIASGPNDLIGQFAVGNSGVSVSSVAGLYVLESAVASSGYADNLNTTSGAAVSWTFSTSAAHVFSAIAINESTSSAHPAQPWAILP